VYEDFKPPSDLLTKFFTRVGGGGLMAKGIFYERLFFRYKSQLSFLDWLLSVKNIPAWPAMLLTEKAIDKQKVLWLVNPRAISTLNTLLLGLVKLWPFGPLDQLARVIFYVVFHCKKWVNVM